MEDLAREEEDLLRSIATLKRRIPFTTATNWATQSREGIAADEAALEAARERAVAAQTGGSEGEATRKVSFEGIGPLERQESVEGGYAGAVDALGRLKRDMPATVAKMERARVAGGYVVTRR